MGYIIDGGEGALAGIQGAHNAYHRRKRRMQQRGEWPRAPKRFKLVEGPEEIHTIEARPSFPKQSYLDRMASSRRYKRKYKRKMKKYKTTDRKKYKRYRKKYKKAKKTLYEGSKKRVSKTFTKKVVEVQNNQEPYGKWLQVDYARANPIIDFQDIAFVPFKRLDTIQNAFNNLFPGTTVPRGRIIVEHASLALNMRNTSQMDIFCDYYVFRPSKLNLPSEDVETMWNMGVTNQYVGAGAPPTCRTLGMTPFDSCGLKKSWQYKREAEFIIKPGQCMTKFIVDSNSYTLNYNGYVDGGGTLMHYKPGMTEVHVFVCRGAPVFATDAKIGTGQPSANPGGSTGLLIEAYSRFKLRVPSTTTTFNKQYTFNYTNNLGAAPIAGTMPYVEKDQPSTVVTY